MNKPHAYILIGLPACGKSTWTEQRLRGGQYFVVSSDAYIEAMAQAEQTTYSAVFDTYVGQADHYAQSMFEVAIEEKSNIIIDRTNCGRKTRRRWLDPLRKNGYHVAAVVFRQPLNIEDLRPRLDARIGKDIPWGVIKQMASGFVWPTYEEGFDNVMIIDSFA